MRLPIRKPGQYTHLKPGAQMTEAKFNELQNKLAKLKISRPASANEVKRLTEMGDFSENAAYQIAKGRLRGLNQKILEIEDHLRRAIIIKPDKNTAAVQLGTEVTIQALGKQKTYLILGSAETNPAKGIISHDSPVGAALMGRRVGDKIKINLARKKIQYKIFKIN